MLIRTTMAAAAPEKQPESPSYIEDREKDVFTPTSGTTIVGGVKGKCSATVIRGFSAHAIQDMAPTVSTRRWPISSRRRARQSCWTKRRTGVVMISDRRNTPTAPRSSPALEPGHALRLTVATAIHSLTSNNNLTPRRYSKDPLRKCWG